MSVLSCAALFFLLIKVNCNSSDLLQYYVDLIQTVTTRSYASAPKTNAYEYIPKFDICKDYGTYDHIVVGAGSAGAVIANRLTEDRFRNVLLVEAGGLESDFTDIPGMSASVIGLPEYNWNSFSVPQKTCCLGMNDKKCAYYRGKGLGGSSIINFLTYTRGNKDDYDNWNSQGCTGWSYNDVLPFFKKIENFVSGNSKYRGKGGYLNVEADSELSDVDKAFLEANNELGRNLIDYNAGEKIGAGIMQLNRLNGKRHSTGRAYLEPVRHRKNLKVLINSYVIKILINKYKRAYGVLFSKDGTLNVVRSHSDIIICAGAVGSPQLLMLSGIGPKDHLNQLGIPIKQHLAVGENVKDHTVTLFTNFVSNQTIPSITLKESIINYLNFTGTLTNPLNSKVLAFLNTKNTSSTQPDVELLLFPYSDAKPYLKFYNVDRKLVEDLSKIDPQFKFKFMIILILLHPESKGTLRLQSSNPFDYPLIDPQLLSDKNNIDIETIYKGVQSLFEITNTNAFKKVGAEYLYTSHPNCENYKHQSRDYWYCNIRHFTSSGIHLTGTCKMGDHPVTGAVVNPQLQVFGIKNLRVADASIIPSSISGHINAAAIMIGEKLSHLIRNDL
ncbi:hypothetical protein FQA39_LY06044 [Lamprigera yunnana]|nr:hypothetical protein FQA39_LY06044 [Lamprigera yunnana]